MKNKIIPKEQLEFENMVLEANRIAGWLEKTEHPLDNLESFITLLLLKSGEHMNLYEMAGICEEVKSDVKEAIFGEELEE